MSLKDDLIKVGFSNLIVLSSGVFNSFVLPFLLTIKGYADYRTFILYASFIGFLHLGFVDGINVKYGGINRENINFKEFGEYHSFFIIFQIIITAFFLLIGLIVKNEMIFFICMAIIPINLQSFFLFFFQAIGEFHLYSRAIIIVPLCNITITLILLLLAITNYRIFVIANIFSYYLSIIFIEIQYRKVKGSNFSKSSINNKVNMKKSLQLLIPTLMTCKNIFFSGFLIMTGTIIFNLFFSTGQWIVKIFTADEMFAIYSLSLSLIGLVIVFVSAVNKTFYPYLHKNPGKKTIKRLRKILYIVSTLTLPAFFILKFVIVNFLPKYLDALPITAILITSVPGIFIVKSIYVNLYKVQKKEAKFLRDSIIYFMIGCIFNISAYLYFKSLDAIALASVLTIYTWTLFPLSFNILSQKNRLSEFIYLSLIIGSFYVLNLTGLNYILSFVISLLAIFGINLLFLRRTFLSLIKINP